MGKPKEKSQHEKALLGVHSSSSNRLYSQSMARLLRGSGSSEEVFAEKAGQKPGSEKLLFFVLVLLLGFFLLDSQGLLPF